MNDDDTPVDIRNKANQITGRYGLKLSDSEFNELVEHLVAFERRAETIRGVKIEGSEEPALKLFVESPGLTR